MELSSALATDAPTFPSIRDAVPIDLGGIYARKGFSYQDDVAAGFYIEMLSNDTLLEVCCETHDDIVMVRQRDAEPIAEFVQVKAEHPEQLWTASLLCAKPTGLGSSILEKSLARDRYAEVSTFRLVTCRQVRSELTILTWARNHESRSLVCADFAALANDVSSKLVGIKSAKGCDSTNWLIQTKWDVISETEITSINCQALAIALHKMGHSFDPDSVRAIYEHLRTLAKNTAEFGKERWSEKPVTRAALLERLKEWINPYPDMGQVERLEAKLDIAGLDDVCKKAAVDQRRNYLKKRRTPGYLSTEQAEDVENAVLDTLHMLRSSLDSGEIDETGVKFHGRCLNEVKKIAAPSGDQGSELVPGYLAGCMYEITARCRHRFTKQN